MRRDLAYELNEKVSQQVGEYERTHPHGSPDDLAAMREVIDRATWGSGLVDFGRGELPSLGAFESAEQVLHDWLPVYRDVECGRIKIAPFVRDVARIRLAEFEEELADATFAAEHGDGYRRRHRCLVGLLERLEAAS